jgi:hypothetical protein
LFLAKTAEYLLISEKFKAQICTASLTPTGDMKGEKPEIMESFQTFRLLKTLGFNLRGRDF